MRALPFSIAICLLLAPLAPATPLSALAQNPQPGGVSDCPSPSGFELACGQAHPEDMAQIGDTRWVITSGFSPGAGIALLDTKTHKFTRAYTRTENQVRPDRRRFPSCPSAPDPKLFNAQGISLRSQDRNQYTLYVVNHGGRDSIEVFDVDGQPDVPALTWRGCLDLPAELAAINAVATYSDGTILFTVLVYPGDTYADFVEGKNTGGVYEWRPGTTGYKLIPGTRLPGNNGLETAADDSGFFVVAFGRHAILRFSRASPSAPPVQAIAPGFMPDNIHWDHGRLLTAGMMYDEPACGGTRKVIDGKADTMLCHRGTVVAELDPATMEFHIVAYAPPDPVFNGASTALLIGNQLWVGSYQSNCVAYRSLPWLHAGQTRQP